MVQLIAQPLEEPVKIRDTGDGRSSWELEELELAVDVVEGVVERCGGNKDDLLAEAYLVNLLEPLCVFVPEPVRFIDEYVVELLGAILQNMVQFADGLYLKLSHPELKECLIPVVLQNRRADNEFPSR